MDGLFGDLDIASANENPFFKPDGTYLCEITKAEIKTSKKGNKGFTLDYTIMEGPKKGKKIQEWKPIPMPWQLKGFATADSSEKDEEVLERAERSMAFLKQRLKDFGIPVDMMNAVDSDYLLNNVRALLVTIKNNDGQENITGVKIAEDHDDDRDPFSS